jgi:hypothetical protein
VLHHLIRRVESGVVHALLHSRLAARNDFVFFLTPFKEKVADESCVMSTYDTGLSGRSQTGESVRQLENAVFYMPVTVGVATRR